MPLTRSHLLRTADRFLEAYNKWTVSSVLSIRSSTCIHHTLPKSDSRPAYTNAEFAAMLETVIPIFRGFHLIIIDENATVVDIEARKVMLHLKSKAETDVGPYENEYIFTLTMTEDGEKVDEIVEFLDSEYTAQFVKRLHI